MQRSQLIGNQNREEKKSSKLFGCIPWKNGSKKAREETARLEEELQEERRQREAQQQHLQSLESRFAMLERGLQNMQSIVDELAQVQKEGIEQQARQVSLVEERVQALLEQIPQAAPLSPPAAPPTPQADDLRPIVAELFQQLIAARPSPPRPPPPSPPPPSHEQAAQTSPPAPPPPAPAPKPPPSPAISAPPTPLHSDPPSASPAAPTPPTRSALGPAAVQPATTPSSSATTPLPARAHASSSELGAMHGESTPTFSELGLSPGPWGGERGEGRESASSDAGSAPRVVKFDKCVHCGYKGSLQRVTQKGNHHKSKCPLFITAPTAAASADSPAQTPLPPMASASPSRSAEEEGGGESGGRAEQEQEQAEGSDAYTIVPDLQAEELVDPDGAFSPPLMPAPVHFPPAPRPSDASRSSQSLSPPEHRALASYTELRSPPEAADPNLNAGKPGPGAGKGGGSGGVSESDLLLGGPPTSAAVHAQGGPGEAQTTDTPIRKVTISPPTPSQPPPVILPPNLKGLTGPALAPPEEGKEQAAIPIPVGKKGEHGVGWSMNGVESLFSEEELLHALELANTAPPLPPAFHSGGGMHVHPAVMAQFQQAQGMLGGGGGLEGAYGLQMVSDENANPRLYTPPNLRGGPDPLSETPVLQQPMPQVPVSAWQRVAAVPREQVAGAAYPRGYTHVQASPQVYAPAAVQAQAWGSRGQAAVGMGGGGWPEQYQQVVRSTPGFQQQQAAFQQQQQQYGYASQQERQQQMVNAGHSGDVQLSRLGEPSANTLYCM